MTSKVLLSGGCVLTLGAKTPNFTQADVLIDDGVVAQVGPGLRARDAERVDATDTIVMPGFVDTHRHAWTSLFRNVGESHEQGVPGAGGGRRSLSARGRLRRHPDRRAGRGRGGDHHRRRLVTHPIRLRFRGSRAPGARRRRSAHRVRLRRSPPHGGDARRAGDPPTRRPAHRRGRAEDHRRPRVRRARVGRSRRGRRGVGAGPGARHAHPRPRRFAELGAWRDRRSRRAWPPG